MTFDVIFETDACGDFISLKFTLWAETVLTFLGSSDGSSAFESQKF